MSRGAQRGVFGGGEITFERAKLAKILKLSSRESLKRSSKNEEIGEAPRNLPGEIDVRDWLFEGRDLIFLYLKVD